MEPPEVIYVPKGAKMKSKRKGFVPNRWTKRDARKTVPPLAPSNGNDNNAPFDIKRYADYAPMSTSAYNTTTYNSPFPDFGSSSQIEYDPFRGYAAYPSNLTGCSMVNPSVLEGSSGHMIITSDQIVNAIANQSPWMDRDEIEAGLRNGTLSVPRLNAVQYFVMDDNGSHPVGPVEFRSEPPLESTGLPWYGSTVLPFNSVLGIPSSHQVGTPSESKVELKSDCFGTGFRKPTKIHPKVAEFMCLDLFDVEVSSPARINQFCVMYVRECYDETTIQFSLCHGLRRQFDPALKELRDYINPDRMMAHQLNELCQITQRDQFEFNVKPTEADLEFNGVLDENYYSGSKSDWKRIIVEAWKERGFHPLSGSSWMEVEETEVWTTRGWMEVEMIKRERVKRSMTLVCEDHREVFIPPVFECCVCFDEKPLHRFTRLNCRHRVTCIDCSNELKSCPLCRTLIVGRAKITLTETLEVLSQEDFEMTKCHLRAK